MRSSGLSTKKPGNLEILCSQPCDSWQPKLFIHSFTTVSERSAFIISINAEQEISYLFLQLLSVLRKHSIISAKAIESLRVSLNSLILPLHSLIAFKKSLISYRSPSPRNRSVYLSTTVGILIMHFKIPCLPPGSFCHNIALCTSYQQSAL